MCEVKCHLKEKVEHLPDLEESEVDSATMMNLCLWSQTSIQEEMIIGTIGAKKIFFREI